MPSLRRMTLGFGVFPGARASRPRTARSAVDSHDGPPLGMRLCPARTRLRPAKLLTRMAQEFDGAQVQLT